jgi:hypothetical protein
MTGVDQGWKSAGSVALYMKKLAELRRRTEENRKRIEGEWKEERRWKRMKRG